MPIKKRKKVKKKSGKRQILFYVLLSFAGLAVLLFAVNQRWLFTSKAEEGRIIMLYPNPEAARPNLQLRTFPYITIPPKPTLPPQNSTPETPNTSTPMIPLIGGGKFCPLDDLVPEGSSCQCLDMYSFACPAAGSGDTPPTCTGKQFPFRLPLGTGKWYCVELISPGLTTSNPPKPPPGCFAACIAKPIVYLYPTKKTLVDVEVTTPGDIFISDPLYPQGGWKGIEAHPDGTLYYQGQKYSELFYESTVVEEIAMPETGFVVAVKDLEPKLSEVITKLGLQGREHDEFLEFWVPVLKKQNAPYIFFSILPPDVKDSVDRLTITPKPDTRIEIIAYFKPLQHPISVAPLLLPENAPERIGFTEVEWGGTIGN